MEPSTDDKRPTSRIRTLPDRIANQIAAGEVVERPASVIKELIENALDAGAGSIGVRIRNGGKSLIEVADDGFGMSADDAQLAFERHATSKITSADDLKSVKTLGFRGEALPSIGSVARLTLVTSEPDTPHGTEITIEGGVLKYVKEAPPLTGTSVTVRDLFYNTPVRRKFLRSEQVEAEHALETVYREALARPDVAFTFHREEREALRAPAAAGEKAFATRIADIFGKRILDELAPVSYEYGGMLLTGFVSRPGVTRSTRSTQYIYLNGRHIKDRLVGYAVGEGYRSMIPKGRHPALFLWLTIPTDRVDVNVHPTKSEVRFVDGRSVIQLVRTGVHDAMADARSRTGDDYAATSHPAAGFGAPPSSRPVVDPWRPGDRPETPSSLPRYLATPVATMSPPPPTGYAPPPPAPEAGLYHFDQEISDAFVPLGQVFGSFLLIEDGDRLLLLDQHTTHERILYERLTTKYREGAVVGQNLLFPEELTVSRAEADFLRRHLIDLARLGYVIEEFGETTFTVRSVPALLAKGDHIGAVRDLLERAKSYGEVGSFEELAEEAINIMACRGAVKANDPVSRAETEGLVRQLRECRLPYTCPHGRPVALTIKRDELLRGFLRK